MSIKATIFNVSRSSVSDGPGLRTVIYFKGCNLACEWCHNPEGLSFKREISFIQKKCVDCGRCKTVCEKGCFTESGFDRSNCNLCEKCAKICPSNALEVIGKEYTPAELFNEVKKDYRYFVRGGGITISGGECLFYADFLAEFLKLCKSENINVIVESAFSLPKAQIEKVIGYVDNFYVDLKCMDTNTHFKYTGAYNEQILDNVITFSKKTNVTIRIPLIPSVNDDIINLQKTVLFAKNVGVKGVELLRYNPLGASKYERLGKSGKLFASSEQSSEQIKDLVSSLNAFIGEKDFVYCII